jgi:hypothetical protein
MSKLVLITITLGFTFGLKAQSKIIEGTTLLPSNKDGAIVILPNKVNNQKAETKPYNNQGKLIKVPQSIYRSGNTVTTSSKNTKNTNSGSTLILPKGATVQQVVEPKIAEQQNTQPASASNNASNGNSALTTNWLAPQNTTSNEIVDNVGGVSNEVPSLLTPVLKKYEQPKPTKVVETLDPKKVYPGTVVTQSLGLPPTTKATNTNIGDLAPLDPKDVAAYNAAKNTTTANTNMIDLSPIDKSSINLVYTVPPMSNTGKSIGMPDLVPIDQRNGNATKVNNGMIDLAPIEGAAAIQKAKPNSVMIDLAPIEGGTTTNKQNIGMPDLAPIVDENNGAPTFADIEASKNNQKTNKLVTAEKGLQLPKGTILASQLGLSYIVKPAVPKLLIDSSNNSDNQVQNFRPKAGGGFGMIDLVPIDNNISVKPNQNTTMIDLAPIEYNVANQSQTSMIDLAPIETNNFQPPAENNVRSFSQNYQPQQAPVYYQPQPKKVYTNTIRKKWKPNPCPCAVPKRKWYPPKKRTYSYTKPAPQQPATVVKYIDRPRETIVYVPVQQQQQKVEYKQPAPQEQPKEKFVYTDYTNTYKKTETYNKTCNCNNQQQVNTAPKDPSQYYNPANYAGVSAGPTAGDYAVNPSDKIIGAPMQYTFYVNKKGQYSVSVFNSYASVLISQNGSVIETKINDQQTAANTPKTNYFGAPESMGSIPIEYNYNRSVNRIGDLQITYDFEGFIKSIGSSTVLYNSRSKISQVDNIVINYNGAEATSVSPPNTGRVFLTR